MTGEETVVAKQVNRGTRVAVHLFLIAFLICGSFGIEAWPLTGWKLFSRLRVDRQELLQAVSVDSHGDESAFPFGSLSSAYHGPVHILRDFEKMSAIEKSRVCIAWSEAAISSGHDVHQVRIYRIERRLSKREDGRASPPQVRTLRYVCPIE